MIKHHIRVHSVHHRSLDEGISGRKSFQHGNGKFIHGCGEVDDSGLTVQCVKNPFHHLVVTQYLTAAQIVCLIHGFLMIERIDAGKGQIFSVDRLTEALPLSRNREHSKSFNELLNKSNILIFATSINHSGPKQYPANTLILADGLNAGFCLCQRLDSLLFHTAFRYPLGKDAGGAEPDKSPDSGTGSCC